MHLENGHVAYFTFAVIDVPKENEHGNDNHGSKVVVDPFDGVKFDRDMQRSANAEERKSKWRPLTLYEDVPESSRAPPETN